MIANRITLSVKVVVLFQSIQFDLKYGMSIASLNNAHSGRAPDKKIRSSFIIPLRRGRAIRCNIF